MYHPYAQLEKNSQHYPAPNEGSVGLAIGYHYLLINFISIFTKFRSWKYCQSNYITTTKKYLRPLFLIIDGVVKLKTNKLKMKIKCFSR